MPLFTTDLLELNALNHRILRDEPPPREIDAICFFGQTQENDRIALEAISKFQDDFQCPVLVGICDPIKKNGLVVRGSKAWKEDLIEFEVKKEDIVLYPMSQKFPPSTDAEAWGMIPLIKDNNWRYLLVTVPPLHACRAFVSFVSACNKNKLDKVNVWSAPSEAPPWDEDVFHSGSMPSAPRVDQISGEFSKMMAYCAKGDHITAREVLEYLRKRKRPKNKVVKEEPYSVFATN